MDNLISALAGLMVPQLWAWNPTGIFSLGSSWFKTCIISLYSKCGMRYREPQTEIFPSISVDQVYWTGICSWDIKTWHKLLLLIIKLLLLDVCMYLTQLCNIHTTMTNKAISVWFHGLGTLLLRRKRCDQFKKWPLTPIFYFSHYRISEKWDHNQK